MMDDIMLSGKSALAFDMISIVVGLLCYYWVRDASGWKDGVAKLVTGLCTILVTLYFSIALLGALDKYMNWEPQDGERTNVQQSK